jgi:hypothetical protein
MNYTVGNARALVELNIDTERRHIELLELLSSQSASDDGTSVSVFLNIYNTVLHKCSDTKKFTEYQVHKIQH